MKLPKNPTIKSPIIQWAADAVAWMRANTIHNVIGGKLKRTPNGITIDVTPENRTNQRLWVHPWKATPNGDDTITIAPGSMLSWNTSNSGSFPNEPFYAEDTNYAGGDVTITASGTVFAVVPVDVRQTSTDGSVASVHYIVNGSITVALNPTYSGANLYYPICDVDFTDSIATVTRQLLTHNPILELGYSYLDSP